ncbi:MAG: DUF1127 domain-containing protein [Octadecabacter sp.]|nr:DUF1127 domain-containing protein [Octadecabacter sp.]
MAYVSDIRVAGTNVFARIAGLRAELAARVARYGVYRKTVAELSQLSNRELSDLGMNRSMINGIAYEAAYKA